MKLGQDETLQSGHDLNWLYSQPEEVRRVFVLARHYEELRRDSGQRGYRAFKVVDVTALTLVTFKQFKTVAEWLAEHTWNVSWTAMHWRGFVEFVFKSFAPSIPLPGQMKNLVLLKKYMLSHVSDKPVEEGIPQEHMAEIYKQVLRPELVKVPGMLAALGLK